MPAQKHDFSSSSEICVTISRLSIAFPNSYPITTHFLPSYQRLTSGYYFYGKDPFTSRYVQVNSTNENIFFYFFRFLSFFWTLLPHQFVLQVIILCLIVKHSLFLYILGLF